MHTLRLGHAQHYREHLIPNGNVVWFDHLNRLYCFSRSFSGDYDSIRMRECTGAYEIGYEPNSLRMYDWDNPAVIVFHSVRFQIMRHNLVPAKLSEDFSLPILTLLEDVVSYLEANGDVSRDYEVAHQKARVFLAKEKYTIPWDDVSKILHWVQKH